MIVFLSIIYIKNYFHIISKRSSLHTHTHTHVRRILISVMYFFNLYNQFFNFLNIRNREKGDEKVGNF